MDTKKIGICEWYLPYKGVEAIKFAVSAGYNAIQIADQTINQFAEARSREEICKLYVDAASKTGTHIQAYALTGIVEGGGICQKEGTIDYSEMILKFDKALEDCHAMDIKMIIVIGMGESCPQNEFEYERTCTCLKQFVSKASKYGINIAYESYMDIYKTCDLLECVSDLQLLYDTLNPVRRGFGDPIEDIKILNERGYIDRIGAVHIKDMPDSKVGTLPLGKGCADPEEKLKALQSAGYKGWILSENSYTKPPMTDAGTLEENVKYDCKWLSERV